MASLASTSLSLSSTPKSALYSPSSSISQLRTNGLGLSARTPQLGFASFSLWSGLKHIGHGSIYQRSLQKKERRCRHKGGMVVRASLFGVGAPEALVIGVVALLVFGPKGLAEVARNLGKTLRAFQPTIKELQEVSREFKSSLEREIGFDDISNQTQNTHSYNRTDMPSSPPSTGSIENSVTVDDPNGIPSSTRAYTSEEYWKITEEQLKSSAVQQPQQSAPPDAQSHPPAVLDKTAGEVPPPSKPESKS